MKKFEDLVKELLKAGTITQDVADTLTTAKNEHIKVLNDENKALRTEKEDLSKDYENVLQSKNDLDAQVSGLDEKIKQAKLDGKSELATELENERTEKAKLQESLGNLEKANQNLTMDGGITKALADFDVLDSEVVSIAVKQNVTFGEDGKLKYKQGDQLVSLEDGVKAFFEAKPTLLKAVGDGGSGAGGDGASGGAKTSNFVGDTADRKSAIQSMIDADK